MWPQAEAGAVIRLKSRVSFSISRPRVDKALSAGWKRSTATTVFRMTLTYLWLSCLRDFNLLEAGAGDGERIIQLVRAAVQECGQEVVLIIIDTLSRAMASGDENSAQDMTAVVTNIDQIRENVSAHVMIIHHIREGCSTRCTGHSSLRAATDAKIEIARIGKGEDKSALASVRKQRDMAGGDTFPFTLKPIHFGFDEDGEPVTSAVIDTLDGRQRVAIPRAERSSSSCAKCVAFFTPRGPSARLPNTRKWCQRPKTTGDMLSTKRHPMPHRTQSRKRFARTYCKTSRYRRGQNLDY